MTKNPKSLSPQETLIKNIKASIKQIDSLAPNLSPKASKITRDLLHAVRLDLDQATSNLDPVRNPTHWFDPADPETAGRLVAAALLAQPRIPLSLVPRSYGAGVYAIYFTGNCSVYAPISKTETPIYVGKADPDTPTSRNPREQGQRLYLRLADHRKMIRKVETYATLNDTPDRFSVQDFECRRLVTATNAQTFAERHLIDLFKPVWNKETKVCWGISKHGDTHGRNNDRSPWDVLHPGRAWAMADKLADSRSLNRIKSDLEAHFSANPAYRDRDEIIDQFLSAFAQDPMTAFSAVEDDDVPVEAPRRAGTAPTDGPT